MLLGFLGRCLRTPNRLRGSCLRRNDGGRCGNDGACRLSLIFRSGLRCRLLRCRLRLCARFLRLGSHTADGFEQVLARDAASGAGAPNRRQVYAVLRRQPRHERRDDVTAVRFRDARRCGLVRALGERLLLQRVGASLAALPGAGRADAADAVHELEGGLRGLRGFLVLPALRRIGTLRVGTLCGWHRPRAADASGVFSGGGFVRFLHGFTFTPALSLEGEGVIRRCDGRFIALIPAPRLVRCLRTRGLMATWDSRLCRNDGIRLRGSCLRRNDGRLLAFDVHLADGLAHRDGLALLGEGADEDARVGRRGFHAHLVGDDLDEGVVLLDVLSRLHQPFADDALRHRLTHLRQFDDPDHTYRFLCATGSVSPL